MVIWGTGRKERQKTDTQKQSNSSQWEGRDPRAASLTVPSGLFLPTILYCFVSWEQEPAISVYLFIYSLVLQREIIHILILVLNSC